MGSVTQKGASDLICPSLNVGKVLSFSNKFQGSGGTVFRDQSPRDNDGNLAGATTGVILKHEYLFDGVDDYVACGDIKTTGPATVSMWIYPTAEDGRLWSQASGSVGQSGAAGINSGALWIWNGITTQNVIGSGITLNTWQHVAVTFNGNTTATGWLDGEENTTIGVGTYFNFDGVGFDLFGRFVRVYGNEFEGRCKDVIIYNRALADNEIRTLAIRPDIATERTPYVYEPIRVNYDADLVQSASGIWCPSVQGPGGLILRDLSKNSNDGTLTGGSALSSRDLDLDGIDGVVSLESAGDGTYNFPIVSVSAWVRRDASLASFDGIVQSEMGTSDNGWGLFGNSTNEIHWDTNGSGWAASPKASLPINEWHHVVGIHDGSVNHLWFDGVYVGGTSGASLLYTGTRNVGARIGRYYTTQYWPGQIDDVRIYPHALKPQQIKRLYSGGQGRGIGLGPDSLVSPYTTQWGSVAAAEAAAFQAAWGASATTIAGVASGQ